MQVFQLEKYLEKFNIEVYPITLLKFVLNEKRIMSFISKVSESTFEPKAPFKIDNKDCERCKEQEVSTMCRQHTSISRVMTARTIMKTIIDEKEIMFYRNEIFNIINDELMTIIYCPHPKLITGNITDAKVRKINIIIVKDENIGKVFNKNNKTEFIDIDLNELKSQNISCWFNNQFTIMTLPDFETKENGKNSWCLIANR